MKEIVKIQMSIEEQPPEHERKDLRRARRIAKNVMRNIGKGYGSMPAKTITFGDPTQDIMADGPSMDANPARLSTSQKEFLAKELNDRGLRVTIVTPQSSYAHDRVEVWGVTYRPKNTDKRQA